jgi:hypothetical protein
MQEGAAIVSWTMSNICYRPVQEEGVRGDTVRSSCINRVSV